jgi:hypothetical protein
MSSRNPLIELLLIDRLRVRPMGPKCNDRRQTQCSNNLLHHSTTSRSPIVSSLHSFDADNPDPVVVPGAIRHRSGLLSQTFHRGPVNAD